MSFLQPDVVLIPVPFTGLTSAKRRPVLVLSSTALNGRSPDILVAAITSNIVSPFGGLTINASDLDNGSLPTTSIVRPEKLYTLSQPIVGKRFGRLGTAKFDDVLNAIDLVPGRVPPTP